MLPSRGSWRKLTPLWSCSMLPGKQAYFVGKNTLLIDIYFNNTLLKPYSMAYANFREWI